MVHEMIALLRSVFNISCVLCIFALSMHSVFLLFCCLLHLYMCTVCGYSSSMGYYQYVYTNYNNVIFIITTFYIMTL